MSAAQLQPPVFLYYHFKRIVDFILYDVPLISDNSNSATNLWKQELFALYSAGHRNGKQDYSRVSKKACNSKLYDIYRQSLFENPSLNLLWFWACHASADFTISSRLKTPLGKPQETLMAIECELYSLNYLFILYSQTEFQLLSKCF